MKAAREAHNALKATIKSDGFLIEEIRDAIQLETDDGEASFKQMMERKLRVARWMGVPVGVQAELFTDAEPDRAYNEGKRHGLAGDRADNPYAANTADYSDWMKGWSEGQAVLASGFKRPSETASDDDRDLRPRNLRQPNAASEDFDDAVDDADALEEPPVAEPVH